MEAYSYGRGSLSKATKDAIRKWLLEHEVVQREVEFPDDPVRAIRGIVNACKEEWV